MGPFGLVEANGAGRDLTERCHKQDLLVLTPAGVNLEKTSKSNVARKRRFHS